MLYNRLSAQIDHNQLSMQDTQEKTHAPNFTVYDTDGNEVKLSDYLGKPIVLNFWASWCNPCISEISSDISILQTGMPRLYRPRRLQPDSGGDREKMGVMDKVLVLEAVILAAYMVAALAVF